MSEDRPLSTPNPDPTILTTQSLLREISALKELMIARIEESSRSQESRLSQNDEKLSLIRSIIETRLDDMDKGVRLLQEIADKAPARTDEKIKALAGVSEEKFRVHEEKFNSIQLQFRERDVRTEQSSKDSKVAVDAALQAAKEAVGEQNKSSALAIAKSEAATTKQIDQMTQIIQTGNKGLDDKIADMKERVTVLEGAVRASQIQRTESSQTQHFSASLIVAIIAVIISFAGTATVIAMSFRKLP